MTQSIVLGIGSGRCGASSLAAVLNHQPGVQVNHEEPPLLPWKREPGEHVIRERLARFRRTRDAHLVGDVASFYLPYLEDAIAVEPGIRIVCLKRPREEVIESFCRWLEQANPLPTNHWARTPASGWHHDPIRTRIFPQYETQDRREGIARYWDEYYARVSQLIARYPDQVRLFETERALNTEDGLRELLGFVGIPPEQQVLALGIVQNKAESQPGRKRLVPPSDHPLDPRRCVILVPFAGQIYPHCERALKELERRGYPVWRVGGYAAIDQGRNQMATDALRDGFEETMWVDADIDFHPDTIDRVRSHNLTVVCGIYPQKSKRAIACQILPGRRRCFRARRRIGGSQVLRNGFHARSPRGLREDAAAHGAAGLQRTLRRADDPLLPADAAPVRRRALVSRGGLRLLPTRAGVWFCDCCRHDDPGCGTSGYAFVGKTRDRAGSAYERFTLHFPGSGEDERPGARRAARQ